MAPAMVIGPFHHPRFWRCCLPSRSNPAVWQLDLAVSTQQSVAQIGTLLVAEQIATNAGQAQGRDDPGFRDVLDLDRSMVWIRRDSRED